MELRYKRELEKLIEKAEKSLEASENLYNSEFYDFAVSRIYYSMFYCVKALLLTKEINPKKHSGVLKMFAKEFIKTNELDVELFEYINEAYNYRQTADYDATIEIKKEEAEYLLHKGHIFLNKTKKYLISKNILKGENDNTKS
ncbi:HEPN domain-containing protein [Methanocaldococcus jannaschii]|nr:HEPN domain-containing protein [Methanocaldococcus jannaschii]